MTQSGHRSDISTNCNFIHCALTRCYSLLFEIPKTAPLVRTLDAMWLPDNTVSKIEKTHK